MLTLPTREIVLVVDPYCLEDLLTRPLQGVMRLVVELATSLAPPIVVRLVAPMYLATDPQLTNAQSRGLPLTIIETDDGVPALKLSNDLKRRKRERIERGAEGDCRGLRLLALADHLRADGIVTELPSLAEVKWDLLAHHKFRIVHPHEISDMVEVFARGHSIFCAAQPVPTWHSPDLIYQMTHWKARLLFEWFGTFNRKVSDAELRELVRSALLNRYTFILYARDMVRFNDLQKDYHFRRGRHPKVFRATLNYHLTAFYIHVWGMLDSLAGIANRQLGLGVHPFRCGITQDRFLEALSQKRPGLARFIRGHRSEWIDVLGDVRHPVAHSALRLQSDVVRPSEDSRKTDAEISAILRREDPETYAVLPPDMLRALEPSLVETWRLNRMKVVTDDAIYVQQAGGGGYWRPPVASLDYDLERLNAFIDGFLISVFGQD